MKQSKDDIDECEDADNLSTEIKLNKQCHQDGDNNPVEVNNTKETELQTTAIATTNDKDNSISSSCKNDSDESDVDRP